MSSRNAPAIDAEVRAVMDKYGITANECWQVPGGRSYAIKHSAIERVIAQRGIFFDAPQVLEGSTPNKAVALLVVGHMAEGDEERQEWSIGEASAANCKNSYLWAMAEKRAKDRVALKLLRAHGIYSEDEADDFREPERHQDNAAPAPQRTSAGNREAIAYVALAKTAMQNAASKAELRDWWEREKSNRQLHFTTSDDPLFCELREAFAKRGQSLPEFAEAAE